MVATFFELRSSAVTVSYFEQDGYYAKNDPEHRQASFWHGGAAKALGLRGHVRPKRFESVLAGFVPGTDIRLGRMREGERVHRPGWDITFSAPKSVSLEALVMGDRRVIRAHDEAVRATLDWVEADLLETRGWDPATRRRPRVKADGMVVAGFRHLTSRDLDPFLHTHCVLANMTRNAAGEWRSVEPTRIRRSEKLIGAYYRNELARRLEALGMAIAPRLVGRIPGFELAGYSRAFVEAFSGRSAEIEAYLERQDLPRTAKNTQKAALRTRKPKRDKSVADLVPAWRARARRLGLVREKAVLSPPRPLDPLTGERSAVPRMPASGLPANELRKLKRAPALPKLPRGEDMAGRHAVTARTRPRSPAPAELSREPELGLLEAVARAVAHVEERQVRIPEAEIRAVALGHAPGATRWPRSTKRSRGWCAAASWSRPNAGVRSGPSSPTARSRPSGACWPRCARSAARGRPGRTRIRSSHGSGRAGSPTARRWRSARSCSPATGSPACRATPAAARRPCCAW